MNEKYTIILINRSTPEIKKIIPSVYIVSSFYDFSTSPTQMFSTIELLSKQNLQMQILINNLHIGPEI